MTIDRIIVDFFKSGFYGAAPDWVGILILTILSLVIAAICSAIMGLEREFHGHAAGLRTHLLVAVGSALIMIISIYGFPTDVFPNRDPARLAAQVVSGIGFLGAGTIIQTGVDVKGLTTATTLWVAMAVGLAAGSGNFVIALIASAVAFGCLVLLRGTERLMARRNPMLIIVVPADKPVLKDINQLASRYSINVISTNSELSSYQGQSALRIVMRVNFASQSSMTGFIEEIRSSVRPLELNVTTQNS